MLENVECLGHSTIKFKINNKIIYIDPYNIKEEYKDADLIFITHNHYDHFSKEDIIRIKNENTIIVITEDIYNDALELNFEEKNIVKVIPNREYQVEEISFNTIPSYNINKKFHPKENNWVGYILNLNNIKYYIAGDTDIIDESKIVKCDVAFLPIGGTYTMNYKEAAELANIIKPKIVVPIHYGIIVGTKEDATNFKELINKDIECKIMY